MFGVYKMFLFFSQTHKLIVFHSCELFASRSKNTEILIHKY